MLQTKHLVLSVLRGIIFSTIYALVFLITLDFLFTLTIHLGTLANHYGDAMQKMILGTEIIGIGILFFVFKAITYYWKTKKAAK